MREAIHGTSKRQVAAMFAEEKPFLLPLPVEPWATPLPSVLCSTVFFTTGMCSSALRAAGEPKQNCLRRNREV